MINKRINSFDDVLDVLEDLKSQTDGVSIGAALDELGYFMDKHLDDVIDQLKSDRNEMESLNERIDELEEELENQ